jgi:hypothetical protein
VVSDYALAVFPGTPPGQYYLMAWIERPATGEVIGQFPLTAEDTAVTVTRPLIPPQPADFDLKTRLEASFGALRLLGYNFTGELWNPGEPRPLELFWAMSPDTGLPENVVAGITLLPHFSGPQISNIAHWERPVTPAYPTSRWQPGDRFRDVWPLTLPGYIPKGDYDLQLSVNNHKLTIGQIEVGGRERLFDRPHISSPLEATVGDSIKLVGYGLNSQPGTGEPQLSLTLFWQATGISTGDYTVFVQLLDLNNQIVAQRDSQPQSGGAPTATWTVGEIVVDEYTLPLPEQGEGEYRLIVGMYRPDTGERLRIVVDNNETDALTLTTIEAER